METQQPLDDDFTLDTTVTEAQTQMFDRAELKTMVQSFRHFNTISGTVSC